eukprot:1084685-Amphidinium_carterae.2
MQWAELVRGAVCFPTVPSGKRIDFFVLSHSLLGKYGGVMRQPHCITKHRRQSDCCCTDAERRIMSGGAGGP